MGQKVNPIGLRIGIIKDWKSRWFSRKNYRQFLHEDLYVRKFVKEKLYHGGISSIEIERTGDQIRVRIMAARPGIVIGKKGIEVDMLRTGLQRLTGKQVNIDVLEVKDPELDAQLIAENIAGQLLRRVSFRRAMKKAIATARQMGNKGIKVCCGGRLGGAEIARREWYMEGRVPLHTLRADIDYGFAEAFTTYGVIGTKVWLFKGEVLGPERQISQELRAQIERKTKGPVKKPRPPRPEGSRPRGARPPFGTRRPSGPGFGQNRGFGGNRPRPASAGPGSSASTPTAGSTAISTPSSGSSTSAVPASGPATPVVPSGPISPASGQGGQA